MFQKLLMNDDNTQVKVNKGQLFEFMLVRQMVKQ